MLLSLPLLLLLLFWLSFRAQRGTCCLPFFAYTRSQARRSDPQSQMEHTNHGPPQIQAPKGHRLAQSPKPTSSVQPLF